MYVMNHYCAPIKIKNGLSNSSILAEQYTYQKNKVPFLRLYLDNVYLSDMGWHGDINYFNMLSLNVLMSEIENDIRVKDVFINNKTGKNIFINKILTKEIIYNTPEGINEEFFIGYHQFYEEYSWGPVYYAAQDDKILSFYHMLHDIFVSDYSDSERSEAISFLRGILSEEGRRNAVRWLNIEDERFSSVLSQYKIV